MAPVNVLLLGGTRFVGRVLARVLVDAGARVTVLHRGLAGEAPAGTRSVIGDRSQPDGLAALAGDRFDVVVDLSSYASAWTRSAIGSFAGKVGHYVYISSGAVYRPSAELPWPESTPLGPNPIWGRYGEEKVASEQMLWQAHEDGAFPVTLFRYPFVLGPGNFADRESFVCSRLRAGRPILLPGGGDALTEFVYVDDTVRALVAAIEQRDVSSGQAYNCAYARSITIRGWVELTATVLDTEPTIVPVDEAALGVASPTVDLTDVVFPYPNEHYVLDGAKLERELDVRIATGNRRMLEEYVEAWTPEPPREYAREQRALAALGIP
jgi:nucleoside-diphosphate-sugar epimerase